MRVHGKKLGKISNVFTKKKALQGQVEKKVQISEFLTKFKRQLNFWNFCTTFKKITLGESWFSFASKATLFSPDVQAAAAAAAQRVQERVRWCLRRASKSVVLQHTCRRNLWPWNNFVNMEPYPSRRPLASRYTTSPTNGRFSPTCTSPR